MARGQDQTATLALQHVKHQEHLFLVLHRTKLKLRYIFATLGWSDARPTQFASLCERESLSPGRILHWPSAREAGFTAQSQKYHADRGSWMRIDRGLYRLAEWPSNEFDSYSRWYTWSEARGVISHDSAAVIHNIGELNPREVHLTLSDHHRTRLTGIVLHRGYIPDDDSDSRDTFRVTIPTRTILDLADSAITQEQFTSLLTDAVDQLLTDPAALMLRADYFGPQAALRIERALSAYQEQTRG